MRILCALTTTLVLSIAAARSVPAAQSPPASTVCALLSLEDAQRIMGGPMKLKPNRGAIVCMYELTEGSGTVALTVVRSSDHAAEERAWASMKETRHLQTGQKNTKSLPGVGDEAWFTGNVEKGKVGVAAIVARKGNAHFAIDVMTLDYRASPDALNQVARKIAQQL
ncbi:MAG TPA: hypothetical protein VGJ29_12465 [Vicinamibacterales bacterium]